MARAASLKSADRHERTFWNEVYVYALRFAALAIVGVVTAITVVYAISIFYDREALLTSTFRCVTDAIDSSGSEHWIVSGTLLGAVRLQHFVMWDTEVDLALLLDRVKDSIPIVGRITEACPHLNRVTSSHSTALYAGGADASAAAIGGSDATTPGSWRLCSGRVCVVLYEYVRMGAQLLSPTGTQAIATALPTSRCVISGVNATCPNDDEFFLNYAFGDKWRTERLTKLFK